MSARVGDQLGVGGPGAAVDLVVGVVHQGADLLRRAQDAIEATESEFLRALTPAQRDDLYALLLRVVDDQTSP